MRSVTLMRRYRSTCRHATSTARHSQPPCFPPCVASTPVPASWNSPLPSSDRQRATVPPSVRPRNVTYSYAVGVVTCGGKAVMSARAARRKCTCACSSSSVTHAGSSFVTLERHRTITRRQTKNGSLHIKMKTWGMHVVPGCPACARRAPAWWPARSPSPATASTPDPAHPHIVHQGHKMALKRKCPLIHTLCPPPSGITGHL